jgi:hypothetical protein
MKIEWVQEFKDWLQKVQDKAVKIAGFIAVAARRRLKPGEVQSE